jgi:hypothetical protein
MILATPTLLLPDRRKPDLGAGEGEEDEVQPEHLRLATALGPYFCAIRIWRIATSDSDSSADDLVDVAELLRLLNVRHSCSRATKRRQRNTPSS